MPDSETDKSAGTSGKVVIVLIAAGLLLITIVTVALYFATRQLDEDGTSAAPTPVSRLAAGDFRSERMELVGFALVADGDSSATWPDFRQFASTFEWRPAL